MKTARFLLACLAISALAACGTDPVAPEAPTAPVREESTQPASGTPTDGGTSSVQCTDGICITIELTKQAGSGG
ncbi:MAG TPA: hypothetical protein VHG91_12125 [Longimicrobium sp.]|nr:hypothetical protein [Longimicrobium sp.]